MQRKLVSIGMIVGLMMGFFGMVRTGHAASFAVNSVSDTVDAALGNGVCADAGGQCSLRAAIMEANATGGTNTITLALSTYTLSLGSTGEDAAASGDLDITAGTLTIEGTGAGGTIINAGTTNDRVFDLRNKASLTLRSLAVVGGKGGSGDDEGGGGIRATGGGNLALEAVQVSGNSSPVFGGGILFNFQRFGNPVPGSLSITNSAIRSNIADRTGGGIVVGGGSSLQLTGSEVFTNTARGVDLSGIQQYGGGGLYLASGFQPISGPTVTTTVTINTTIFDDNFAAGSGAQLRLGGAIFSASRSILTINGSTFTNNRANTEGGAIYSSSILGISGGTFNGNQAINNAGALEFLARTTINGTSFLNNRTLSAGSAFGGGALEGFGPLLMSNALLEMNRTEGVGGAARLANATSTLNNVQILNNRAALDGGGLVVVPGAIANIVNLTDSVVASNIANLNGGGVFNGGRMTISGSDINNNSALAGNGGGVHNFQSFSFVMTNTLVRDNTAGNYGGGIFSRHNLTISNNNKPPTPSLSGVTVTRNRAPEGGGIANDQSLRVVNSAIINNTGTFGGGIRNAERSPNSDFPLSLELVNVTIGGNSASDSGGGIYNQRGVATVNNATIANNSVELNSTIPMTGTGGGIFNDPGSSPSISVQNSILANNQAGMGPDCSGTVTSGNYNLIETTTGCTINGTTTNNITGSDPLLGPLQDNGGGTQTYALQGGSPALNAGSPLAPGSGGGACALTDQRTAPRTGPCDMGAWEDAQVPVPTATTAPTNTAAPTSTATPTDLPTAVPTATTPAATPTTPAATATTPPTEIRVYLPFVAR